MIEAGSVRVNLTIPGETDQVLAELAALTGRGKATFAADAVTWYLPQLLKLLRDVKAQQGAKAEPEGKTKLAASGPGAAAGRLSPAERVRQRALEKRKAALQGRG